MLPHEVRPELHAYLAAVARNHDCECFCVGGVADRAHLAVRLSRTITVAQPVADLKSSSSKRIKTQSPPLAHFARQHGYGAFSVGPSDLEALRTYLRTQEEHHRVRTFQEEYRAFLKRYGIVYDERYVWDLVNESGLQPFDISRALPQAFGLRWDNAEPLAIQRKADCRR